MRCKFAANKNIQPLVCRETSFWMDSIQAQDYYHGFRAHWESSIC